MSADDAVFVYKTTDGKFVSRWGMMSDEREHDPNALTQRFDTLEDVIDYSKDRAMCSEYGFVFCFDTNVKEERNMVETKTYLRNPFEVEAVQVTEENMQEVADWTRGRIRRESAKDVAAGQKRRNYVKVFVYRPSSDKQTQAFVGDWVLYAGQGFKIYTDVAFKKSFSEKVESNVVENFTVKVSE